MKLTKKLSFYEVNPRYFKDYSGNGTGDLTGLANKFDYFKFLGVDAIILQDILSVDEKSKDSSFTKVAETIGNGNDIVKLVSLAKKYDKKLLIELNVGSIKENHNWFSSAQEQDIDEFKNVVEFHNKKESQDLNYSYSNETKQYYVVDSKTQEIPLNWKSEQVLDHFVKVVRYWKELGIDGFVFKNFEYVADVEKKNAMSEATLKELRKFYRAIKEMNDDIIIVGKTNFLPLESASQYTQGAIKVFDYFMSTEVSRLGLDSKFGIDRIGKFSPSDLAKTLKIYASDNANILSFGSRFTGRVLSRWGNDGQYSNESAKALGMLLLLNKSSSSIYYGDEIGMTNIGLTHLDNFQDAELSERKRVAFAGKVSERDFMDAQVLQNPINARSLMAWDDSKNGGFSISEKTITPVSTSYKEINVKNQFVHEESVLLFFRELNKIITNSPYAKIIEDGSYSVSSFVKGVIKIDIKHVDKEIKIIVNITDKVRPIFFRPKSGEVILSTYFNKPYNELPKKLEAYEGIVISKYSEEYAKETQAIKIAELKAKDLAEKEAAKAEAIRIKNEEEAAKAREIAKAKELEEKSKASEEAIKAKEKAELEAIEVAQKKALEEEKAAIIAAREQARLEKEKTREMELAQKLAAKEQARLEKEKTREMEIAQKQALEQEKAKTREMELAAKEQTRLEKEKTREIELAQKQALEQEKAKTREMELAAKEQTRLEKEKTREMELEQKLAAKEQARLEKEKTREVELEQKDSTRLTALKEAAKAERQANLSHNGEKTTLKEEELAKTTLIDDSIDLDELFATEEKKRRGK